MAGDSYDILMERLEYPGSTRLRLIMEELMTPEQAKMVVELPGSPEEVAEKTGIPVDKVIPQLDDLFFKGVIFPRGSFDKREYYRFARSATQFHDATMADQKRDVVKDRRFYELWYDFVMNEYYPRTGKAMQARETSRRGLRIVPAYKSIKELPDVLPCENFHELLKAQELIAVVPCSCRYCTTSVGEHCQYTSEEERMNCFQFGRGAEYAIKRGSGKELSIDEAIEIADAIEEDGLVHHWRNSTQMTDVPLSCQCCRDCCMVYVPVDMFDIPADKIWEKSRYQAYINEEDCTGCQICIDRCQFDAIEMEKPEGSKKYKAVINTDNCIGCGLCVIKCEPEALKMKVVRPPEHIPQAAAA